MDIRIVVNTMLELFLILVLGYGVAKLGIIDSETNKKLSALVVNVSMPALIIASVADNVGTGNLREVLSYLLWGTVFYGVMLLLAWLFTRLMGTPKNQRGTYQFMLIFSNCTFMGYPVMESIFGTEAIFFTSIFNIPFNLLAFSYGILLISKDGEGEARFEAKKLINPGIIASVLALLIFAFGLELPRVFQKTCSIVGNLTTPLSMLVLGASLSTVPIREIVREIRIYPMTLFRLIVLPVITYLLMRLVTDNTMLIGIAALTAAMPVASMSVMLSNQYKGNTKLASIGVFISTLCSVGTIPLVVELFARMEGL